RPDHLQRKWTANRRQRQLQSEPGDCVIHSRSDDEREHAGRYLYPHYHRCQRRPDALHIGDPPCKVNSHFVCIGRLSQWIESYERRTRPGCLHSEVLLWLKGSSAPSRAPNADPGSSMRSRSSSGYPIIPHTPTASKRELQRQLTMRGLPALLIF